jgi:iron-sulfur cluster assembly protein
MPCPALGRALDPVSCAVAVDFRVPHPAVLGWVLGLHEYIENFMPTETASPATLKINVSERAARKILALLAKDGVSPDQGGLRVGVQGGGCSGLSYAMRLDTQARDRDKIFEAFGARVFVDPKSLLYLNGTTLEYEETLMRQGFVFVNPNAARSCGCGSSFTA